MRRKSPSISTGLTIRSISEWADDSLSYTPDFGDDDEALLELFEGKASLFRSFTRFPKASIGRFSRRLCVQSAALRLRTLTSHPGYAT